jgi:hypothetical protein
MSDTPTTGEVKVVLKLDTAEAKAKVEEVERKLKQNEKERTTSNSRVKQREAPPKDWAHSRPNTPFFQELREKFRKNGGPGAGSSPGDILWALNGYKLEGKPTAPNQTFLRQGLDKAFDILNPFPKGGISGDSVGKVGPTLGLAAAIYTGLEKTATFGGLALAYKMKSGEAAAKTPAGEFFNNAQSTFSYISNYVASYRDAADRLVKWDDAVSAVTGKLPDTQFYAPKFQRLAAAELQFQEMVKRNAAWTRAGARGNSSAQDQLGDAAALSISR